MTKLMTSMLVLALSVFASVANAKSADEMVAERIAPVGNVCVQGTECAAAGKAAAASSGPRSGKQVHDTFCAACHGTGAMSAPKTGDKGVWKTRLAKGFNTTLQNAIKGINLMPPKGTCGDCSDKEIGNAIKFMAK